MVSQNSLIFHPERIPWIGAAVLSSALILCLPFIAMLSRPASFFLSAEKKGEIRPQAFAFSLNLNEKIPFLQIPELENEMMFSFDPPRPGGAAVSEGDSNGCNQQVLIHLNKSAESKRAVLPTRIDLRYQGEKLCFSPSESPFWIELSLLPGRQIEGNVFVSSQSEKIHAGRLIASPQESPIRAAQEFSENSPFRLLAETRWWGQDLFREHFERKIPCERLEIGSTGSSGECLELKEGDWIVWDLGQWRVLKEGESIEDSSILVKPIARIQSSLGKTLSLEGWDSEGHVRLSLTPASSSPIKPKGEDLFSAIRVRSEKQISCMLEKQCMILKVGDWVLKSDNRWKVLRKKEERESFLKGTLAGELFVFEQILQKQGNKAIQGKLFNPERSQAVSIEMAVQSMRKSLAGKDSASGIEKGMRKGGKTR